MPSPFVTLKCAATLDGYLDDDSPERLIISSPEDLAAVVKLRAEHDAVLIGAETVRKDNPKLHDVRIKVVVSRSGNVPRDAALFETGTTLVFTSAEREIEARERLKDVAEVLQFAEDVGAVLEVLFQRGVNKLLVEGGAKILASFVEADVFDALRIAISPKVLGEHGRARLGMTGLSELKVVSARKLGETCVVELARGG